MKPNDQISQRLNLGGNVFLLGPLRSGAAGEVSDAGDIGLTLGRADGAACVDQVKRVRGFEGVIISWQRLACIAQGIRLVHAIGKPALQHLDIGMLEIER